MTLAVSTSVKVAGCGEGERSHPLLVASWKEDTSFPISPKRKLRPRKVMDCLSPKLTLLITSAKQTLEALGTEVLRQLLVSRLGGPADACSLKRGWRCSRNGEGGENG